MNKVKYYRLISGLLLKDLSEKTGLSVGHLSHIENGNKQPSKSAMESIALAVGSTVPEIKEDGKRVGWLKNVVARFNNGESLDATFTLTYEVAYKRKGWDASTPTADVMYTRLDVKPEK